MAYITLYKRHTESCCEKHGWFHTRLKNQGAPSPDPTYKRCDCPIWFQSNENGKQTRWSSKESVWAGAEKKKRSIEDGQRPARPSEGKTITEAIQRFISAKEADGVAADTLYRHKLILGLLEAFCASKGVDSIRDITLDHIDEWKNSWKLKSKGAKLVRQEKVKNFFKYCLSLEFIAKDPTALWKRVQVETSDEAVRPFKEGEYEKVLATVDKTTMEPQTKARVHACMRLQREAGLSIVDAVCLPKEALVQEGKKFRIITRRQKTGTPINVPISPELGQKLLTVKNGNPKYFFWSGENLPSDAPKHFRKLYRTVFKLAGMNHSSHDFRHTYAVEFLKAGNDIRLLSKALGHASVKTTEKYYAKWSKEQQKMLDAAAERALATIGQPAEAGA